MVVQGPSRDGGAGVHVLKDFLYCTGVTFLKCPERVIVLVLLVTRS